MQEFDNLRVEVHRPSKDSSRRNPSMSSSSRRTPPPIDKGLLFATAGNKQKIYDFVDKYAARGPTDPVPAIKIAYSMHPDLIFFLCDPSDFPDPKGTIELFKSLNTDHKCRVNTIAFLEHDQEGEATLKQISKDSGGDFKYVSQEDLGK